MKRILLITTILILSIKGISQSMDEISAKIARGEIDKLLADTVKSFTINGNVIIYPDTLQIPLNTMCHIELGILYRNTTTGIILTGYKTVTIQRSGSGSYNIVYEPTAIGNITKTNWTLVIINGFVLVKITGVIGVTTKGMIYKYHRLTSNQ